MLLIGAGLPRTGTKSLKLAIEELTGASCYHMTEVTDDTAAVWVRILGGEYSLLDTILEGYAASVDWPASVAWRELAERHPAASVLLSHRGDAETWWRSANVTVWESLRRNLDEPSEDSEVWSELSKAMLASFASRWREPEMAMQAYDRHLQEVRATIAPERLFEYVPGDGWGPVCAALGVPEPDQPFPNLNSTADYRSRQEWT